jgi:hypothetical protein
VVSEPTAKLAWLGRPGVLRTQQTKRRCQRADHRKPAERGALNEQHRCKEQDHASARHNDRECIGRPEIARVQSAPKRSMSENKADAEHEYGFENCYYLWDQDRNLVRFTHSENTGTGPLPIRILHGDKSRMRTADEFVVHTCGY